MIAEDKAMKFWVDYDDSDNCVLEEAPSKRALSRQIKAHVLRLYRQGDYSVDFLRDELRANPGWGHVVCFLPTRTKLTAGTGRYKSSVDPGAKRDWESVVVALAYIETALAETEEIAG